MSPRVFSTICNNKILVTVVAKASFSHFYLPSIIVCWKCSYTCKCFGNFQRLAYIFGKKWLFFFILPLKTVTCKVNYTSITFIDKKKQQIAPKIIILCQFSHILWQICLIFGKNGGHLGFGLVGKRERVCNHFFWSYIL